MALQRGQESYSRCSAGRRRTSRVLGSNLEERTDVSWGITGNYLDVSNCCIDLLRKERLRTHSYLSDEIGNLVTVSVNIEGRVLDSLLVHGALLELEDHQRQILKLIWLDELSYEETATFLELPLGTVKSRASRAQSRLKQIIQEYLSEKGN